MPTVPNLDYGSVQAEPLPGRPNPRFDTDVSSQDFGSGLAQGLDEAAAAGVSQQAQLKQQYDRERVIDANTQLTSAKNAMLYGQVQDDGTRVGGAFALHGTAAINMPETIGPQFERIANGITSTLTPDQQRMFQSSVAQHRDDLNLQLNRYEYEEGNRLSAKVYDNSTSQAASDAALNWRDPVAIGKARLDIKGAVDLYGDRMNWDPVTREQAKISALASMHSGVISQMLADGAPAAAQSYLANEVPRGELPPALQQGLQGKVNVAVADNISDGIMNAYRSPGGMIAGNKALASIDARQDLPDDVKDQIRSDVQGSLDKRRNEARQTMGPAIEQLEEHISSGQVDPADRASVWSLYNAGAFGPSEAGSAIGRLEKAQQDQVQADAWHQQLDQAYQQGHPLDPKDKDIKAGISDLFTQYTKGIDPGTPEWMNRGADIAAKTGVTPQPVIDWARTQLVSGEPDAAAQAAEAIERQSGANPRGLSYAIDPQTKAMAKIVNDAVQAGTPSDAAVENARSISSINDAERTRLETLYKAQVKSTTPLGSLTNEIAKLPGYDQGWFSSNPTIPPAMTGEFQELQHQYFLLTSGNASQANDLAMADLKRTWGISRVNGAPELMQYAPEAMRPGLPVDALRADIEASAAGHTPDPTKVKLLTTAETGESGGSRFALGAPDQFGAYHVLSDEKGRPLTYAIPDFTNDVKDAQAKAAAAGMQRLKAKQAEAKEREQALIDSIKSAQDIGGVM